jgi:hypothetical protein
MLAYTTLGRPRHEFGRRCVNPDAYRGLLLEHLREARANYPDRPWGVPHLGDVTQIFGPLVNHGIWKIGCACGVDFPIYDPEWQAACCFGCGAMYQGIAPPFDYLEIEGVLLARPHMHQRNWMPGETIQMLRQENRAHGDRA